MWRSSLVDSAGFAATRPGVIARAGISLAYLGVLGRKVKPDELTTWVTRVEAGTTLEQVANTLAQGAEYQNSTGFTNTFYWDVQTDQIEPTVDPLSRLEKYDPKTGKFDIPVTAGSIKSTASRPTDAYFLVHGWAPGLTQSTLLNSTPGDPEKWWETADSPWLLNGVTAVSYTGLAQSIVAADKNAEVYAYSWIDQSATPSGSISTVAGKLTADSGVVEHANTANLAVGMNVTGPGIPANAYIIAIGDDDTITLSEKAYATIPAALTVETSQFTFPSQLSTGSAVVTGIDTSHLIAGMTVSGPATAVPANTTIASVDGPNQITLSANAITSGPAVLSFIGENLVYQNQTATTSAGGTTITGLDTSKLTTGMTVSGPGIPLNDTIFSIDSASHVTLNTAATSSETTSLTFKGTDVATLLQQSLYAGQSESYTQQNGLVMANAIHQALSKNFFTYGSSNGAGLIHILGHSHGSKVATIAALTLEEENVPVAQLTLLESPEDGPQYYDTSTSLAGLGGAQNFNWYYLDQMNISKTPVIGSRGSTDSTFVDNYYSYQGVGSPLGGFNLSEFGTIPNAKNELSNVVDVELDPEILYGALSITGTSGAFTTLFGSHDYPPPWYGQTGSEPATAPQNGIYWSPLLNPASVPTGNSYEQVIYYPTGDLSSGSNIVTNVSQLSGLEVGMPVDDYYNPGYISTGTVIAAINTADQSLTLSQPATATASDQTLSVLNQFALNPTSPTNFTPMAQTTLDYATEFTTGTVSDDGSSISLSVNPKDSSAIDAITFNPLAAQGTTYLGAGIDFQVSFSGVPAGQQVQLVVWIDDPAASPGHSSCRCSNGIDDGLHEHSSVYGG